MSAISAALVAVLAWSSTSLRAPASRIWRTATSPKTAMTVTPVVTSPSTRVRTELSANHRRHAWVERCGAAVAAGIGAPGGSRVGEVTLVPHFGTHGSFLSEVGDHVCSSCSQRRRGG